MAMNDGNKTMLCMRMQSSGVPNADRFVHLVVNLFQSDTVISDLKTINGYVARLQRSETAVVSSDEPKGAA